MTQSLNTAQAPAQRKPKDLWLTIPYLVTFFGLGGFLMWATIAPLSEGVTAQGQIVVDNNKKIVQHLEGGIISDIRVEEGDYVEKGDILFEIDALTIRANRDQLAKEEASMLASSQRLEALLAGKESLDIQGADFWSLSATGKQAVIDEQVALFEDQRSNQASKIALLEARKKSLSFSSSERRAELAAMTNSAASLEEEISLKKVLVEEKLARRDELQQLESSYSRLSSQISALRAGLQDKRGALLEIDSEISQAKAAFQEKLSQELLESRLAANQATEKLRTIKDALLRSQVIAPSSGQVMNVQFTTLGGVVRPGEPMLEIVPESSGVWATVNVMPADREMVYPGLDVNARLSGFKTWKAPAITGKVTSISADLKHLEGTEMRFYEARVHLDQAAINSDDFSFIVPGMPVEVFVDSGKQKTLLDYLIEPVKMQFVRGLSHG